MAVTLFHVAFAHILVLGRTLRVPGRSILDRNSAWISGKPDKCIIIMHSVPYLVTLSQQNSNFRSTHILNSFEASLSRWHRCADVCPDYLLNAWQRPRVMPSPFVQSDWPPVTGWGECIWLASGGLSCGGCCECDAAGERLTTAFLQRDPPDTPLSACCHPSGFPLLTSKTF